MIDRATAWVWEDRAVADAVRRVESMLNGDPLRHHSGLTPEQFALDSRIMAKQVVGQVLAALEGRSDEGGACDPMEASVVRRPEHTLGRSD